MNITEAEQIGVESEAMRKTFVVLVGTNKVVAVSDAALPIPGLPF